MKNYSDIYIKLKEFPEKKHPSNPKKIIFKGKYCRTFLFEEDEKFLKNKIFYKDQDLKSKKSSQSLSNSPIKLRRNFSQSKFNKQNNINNLSFLKFGGSSFGENKISHNCSLPFLDLDNKEKVEENYNKNYNKFLSPNASMTSSVSKFSLKKIPSKLSFYPSRGTSQKTTAKSLLSSKDFTMVSTSNIFEIEQKYGLKNKINHSSSGIIKSSNSSLLYFEDNDFYYNKNK